MPPAVTSAPLQTENFSGFDFTILPVPASHMMKSKPEKFSDRKSTRLNSSHVRISYAVFCLKKKKRFLKSLQVLNDGDVVVFDSDCAFIVLGGFSGFVMGVGAIRYAARPSM